MRGTQRVSTFPEMEQVRRGLPINHYLALLHQGATTGVIPIMTTDGQMVGPRSVPIFDQQGQVVGSEPVPPDEDSPFLAHAQPLSPKDRVQILEYLIDKVMPAANYPHAELDTDLKDASAEGMQELPSESLSRQLRPSPAQR